jgi:hypothetical protein
MIHHPEWAIAREVGLRDGLQILARTAPTAHKIDGLRGAIVRAGLPKTLQPAAVAA